MSEQENELKRWQKIIGTPLVWMLENFWAVASLVGIFLFAFGIVFGLISISKSFGQSDDCVDEYYLTDPSGIGYRILQQEAAKLGAEMPEYGGGQYWFDDGEVYTQFFFGEGQMAVAKFTCVYDDGSFDYYILTEEEVRELRDASEEREAEKGDGGGTSVPEEESG